MKRHQRIFVEANGPGPWVCYGCDELVTELMVHHLDEDHENNDPNNLVAMHHPCHSRLHHTGKIVSDETRAKIAGTRRGVPRSKETKRKISVANHGKKLSDEHCRKMSEAQIGRPKNPESVEKMRMTKRGKPWSSARRAAQTNKKEKVL